MKLIFSGTLLIVRECSDTRMYVRPVARRAGIARRLVDAILAHARQHVEAIQLTVVSNNEAARRLYAGLGFVEYGIEKNALSLTGERSSNPPFCQCILMPAVSWIRASPPAGSVLIFNSDGKPMVRIHLSPAANRAVAAPARWSAASSDHGRGNRIQESDQARFCGPPVASHTTGTARTTRAKVTCRARRLPCANC